ncbi:hypothetical protein FSP39_023872 [Pinctada imbricata]|uniref:Uncharacterized protein n=1 Tax=Pinctada imbricata TaxID=66713 RepID=A0AA88Y9K3_PINIB|nr:hypothetical protein FSP39_023872 [Pinctada imbricata]
MEFCERLSVLFGTEKHVRMRRSFVLMREELKNYYHSDDHLRVICSGSLGEGVHYPSSDDDQMMYSIHDRVVKSYREASQRYDLVMVPSECSPGYCLLLDVKQSRPSTMILAMDEMPFLSSLLWKKNFLKIGESIHGPCRSRVICHYEYDCAHCIPCSFWPDIASNWITRNRSHNWPSVEVIQNIMNDGCHVVPIGDQTSPFHLHQWRISFSVAERTLIHSFNHVQFLTYNLLRLCLKRVIEKERPGVLCSYFMKTALFYTAENTSTQFWRTGNMETCLKACLSALYDYVDHGYCPNYFIPEYNMIKRKINRVNRRPLLDIIRSVHGMGISRAIRLCGESFCLEDFSAPELELYQDALFLDSLLYLYTISLLNNVTSKYVTDESETVILSKLSRCIQHSSVWETGKIICRTGIVFCCQKLIHRLLSGSQINKSNNRLHKDIDTLLRIVYKADVSRGKLTAATYMYLIGKTESALSHIRRLLSEYPPYAVDHIFDRHKMVTYIEAMCGRGYTMDYKVRKAHSPTYILHVGILNAIPLPLRIWVSTSTKQVNIQLDSLLYTYCLESLCNIRLQNQTAFKKSIRCLLDRLDDMTDYKDIIDTRMCVGIVMYSQGDCQAACRWLGSAFIMKDSLPDIHSAILSHSVMTYIACLLNHQF